MKELLKQYSEKIVGAISGWDRIRFRGTIRWLASTRGLNTYAGSQGILLKDVGGWAEAITRRVRAACSAQAEKLGIPLIYLRQSGIDKDALARRVAKERGIDTGDICMFSVVEPCYAPRVRGDRATKKLHLETAQRKCVFVYHYWNDPVVGFGHTRLQSWLPLSVTTCINGRHWLERQLLAESIAYVKDGNCFPFIADLDRAQELLDRQQQTHWATLLNELVQRNCPIISGIFGHQPLLYYWSADETEWATDVIFRSTAHLDSIYLLLLRHALVNAQSPAVMRFFGKRVVNGTVHGRMPDEILSDHRTRYEGVRLKHWLNSNSIKAYNKAGNLFRLETTINNTREFKVFRHPNDDLSRPPSWQKMRKGVSDLHRRAQVSQACNSRYAQHIASASITETLQQVAADICVPVTKSRQRHRALNPWAIEDYKLLQFIARGENTINGFRNRNLRDYLHPEAKNSSDAVDLRKLSGRVTRRLRLLRAHGLIKKVTHTTRYVLTVKGHKVSTAILAASSAETQRLMEMSA
jgi:hypothetical protein